jgi:hypothetical protein
MPNRVKTENNRLNLENGVNIQVPLMRNRTKRNYVKRDLPVLERLCVIISNNLS